MSKLAVTLVKSPIGNRPEARSTALAMGLRRLHQTVVVPDNASVRGMVKAISHLVRVEVASEEPKTVAKRSSGFTITPGPRTTAEAIEPPKAHHHDKPSGRERRQAQSAEAKLEQAERAKEDAAAAAEAQATGAAEAAVAATAEDKPVEPGPRRRRSAAQAGDTHEEPEHSDEAEAHETEGSAAKASAAEPKRSRRRTAAAKTVSEESADEYEAEPEHADSDSEEASS